MDIRYHRVGICNYSMGIRNRLLGIRNRHVSTCNHQVGVDCQLGLKGELLSSRMPSGPNKRTLKT
jgi:hypothetical protein